MAKTPGQNSGKTEPSILPAPDAAAKGGDANPPSPEQEQTPAPEKKQMTPQVGPVLEPVLDQKEDRVLGILRMLPRWMLTATCLYVGFFAISVLAGIVGAGYTLLFGGGYVRYNGFEFGIVDRFASKVPVAPTSEYEWQRKKFTLEILLNPEPAEVSDAVNYILACYPTFRSKGQNSNVLDVNQASLIQNNATWFKNIKVHLNRLEGFAASYSSGVVDGEMFSKALKDDMTTWYIRYRYLLDVLKNNCGCTWPALEELFKTKEWAVGPTLNKRQEGSFCPVEKEPVAAGK